MCCMAMVKTAPAAMMTLTPQVRFRVGVCYPAPLTRARVVQLKCRTASRRWLCPVFVAGSVCARGVQ